MLKKNGNLPESICVAPFPKTNPELDDAAGVNGFNLIQQIVTMSRALRSDQKLDPKAQLEGYLYPATAGAAALLTAELPVLEALTNLKFELAEIGAAQTAGASRATPEFSVVLKLSGSQVDAMRQRLVKEIEQLTKVIDSSHRQLGSEAFVSKAPAHVIDGIRAKLADYEAQLAKSHESMKALSQ